MQELDATNAPSANLLTGLRIDEYFQRTDSSNNVSTLLTDALGSTIGLVGSGQNIATSYTYQPFGATTAAGAANGNSYQFTGRENDGTGLYFYRARFYSPMFQRFIAQDPIGFRSGDANLYAYVFNGPTNFRDPFGLCDNDDLCLPTPTPTSTPDVGDPAGVLTAPPSNSGYYCAAPPPPPACPGGDLGVISDQDLVVAAIIGGTAFGVDVGGFWGGVGGAAGGLTIGMADLLGRESCP